MNSSDFDRRFGRAKRFAYTTSLLLIVFWALVIFGAGYLIVNPEVIGEFSARVGNGFEGAA